MSSALERSDLHQPHLPGPAVGRLRLVGRCGQTQETDISNNPFVWVWHEVERADMTARES